MNEWIGNFLRRTWNDFSFFYRGGRGGGRRECGRYLARKFIKMEGKLFVNYFKLRLEVFFSLCYFSLFCLFFPACYAKVSMSVKLWSHILYTHRKLLKWEWKRAFWELLKAFIINLQSLRNRSWGLSSFCRRCKSRCWCQQRERERTQCVWIYANLFNLWIFQHDLSESYFFHSDDKFDGKIMSCESRFGDFFSHIKFIKSSQREGLQFSRNFLRLVRDLKTILTCEKKSQLQTIWCTAFMTGFFHI